MRMRYIAFVVLLLGVPALVVLLVRWGGPSGGGAPSNEPASSTAQQTAPLRWDEG